MYKGRVTWEFRFRSIDVLHERRGTPTRLAVAIGFALFIAASATPAKAQDYTGRIVATGADGGGFAAFNIWVESYTTNEERERHRHDAGRGRSCEARERDGHETGGSVSDER